MIVIHTKEKFIIIIIISIIKNYTISMVVSKRLHEKIFR